MQQKNLKNYIWNIKSVIKYIINLKKVYTKSLICQNTSHLGVVIFYASDNNNNI